MEMTDGWKQPGPTDDWTMAKPKTDEGKPNDFEGIDDPGNWPPFAHRPRFKGSKQKKGTATTLAKGGKKKKQEDQGSP